MKSRLHFQFLALFIVLSSLHAAETPTASIDPDNGHRVMQLPLHTLVESTLFLPAEKARLIDLIKSDQQAAKVFAQIQSAANTAVGLAPHPIRTIETEHLLARDPAKVATQAALKDMAALRVLSSAYAVTNEKKFADRTRIFILAWAKTNHPTGEPIDDSNLEPLVEAYDLTRDTFSTDEQNAVDSYLRALIDAEWAPRQLTNNWQSHRLKMIGLAAYVLRDDASISRAIEGFKAQIAANLNPDGSSFDFLHRDALHYHVYDLEPLLTLAIVAAKHGSNLYDYVSPAGSSLRQSVNFLVPYCTGEKKHREWVNSKVKLDRERAQNGQREYEVGRLFEPQQGFKVLALAAYFDQTTDPIIKQLARQNTDVMSAWTLLLTASRAQ